MNDPHDSELAERARRLLDASLQSLDASTLSRLNRARQAALASPKRRRGWAWSGGIALAGASALALVLALGLHRPSTPAPASGSTATIGDEALLATDDLAMYEDLEFYAWLGGTQAVDLSTEADSGEHL